MATITTDTSLEFVSSWYAAHLAIDVPDWVIADAANCLESTGRISVPASSTWSGRDEWLISEAHIMRQPSYLRRAVRSGKLLMDVR